MMNLNAKYGLEPEYDEPAMPESKLQEEAVEKQAAKVEAAVPADQPVEHKDTEKTVATEPEHVEASTEEAEAEAEAEDAGDTVSPEEETQAYQKLVDMGVSGVSPDYFKLPDAERIVPDPENPAPDRMEGPAIEVAAQLTAEQFEEKRRALSSEISDEDRKDWMKKPDNWPSFITFPNLNDRFHIDAAEAAGELDDKAKERFNQQFQVLADLMVERSAQIDAWLCGEHGMLNDKSGYFANIFKGRQRWHENKIIKTRENESSDERSIKDRIEDMKNRDTHHDVRWGVLLNPEITPGDSRFSGVARWGHNTLITHDGGQVVTTGDEIYVPYLSKSTELAARQIVIEARERGWTHIDISGTAEFCAAAEEAIREFGMGAIITPREKYFANRSVVIMPNPPAMVHKDSDKTKAANMHNTLTSDEGKAPKEGGSKTDGNVKPADPLAGEADRNEDNPDQDRDVSMPHGPL